MQFSHIMVDLETLDTTPSAVVTSIGAVAFDPYSKELGDNFYLELTDDLAVQQERGRTISADTVVWWMRQGQAAQQLFAPRSGSAVRCSTASALTHFTDFVRLNGGKDAKLWGNGADFDNVILGSLYKSFGVNKPWSYGNNRCFRTIKNLKGAPGSPDRVGVHHNALDDAVTQALHLQKIMAHFNRIP